MVDNKQRYKSYPEYKDSGVEWLGDIPSGWNAQKLKYLCTYNDDVLAESTPKDKEIVYVDIGSVSATEGITNTETITYGNSPSRARRIVKDGDVIISTVRTYLEAIAPINNPPENMVVSTGFAVIRPRSEFYKGFASYSLRFKGFIGEVVSRSVGVSYPAINSSDLVNIEIPTPPVDEQKQIAKFLDYETAKIDTLIEKQQRLIELLTEKRQAVISHAVTKGLNPDVPMKDSGVEWLGNVPAHWNVGSLGYYATLETGATPSRANLKYWNGEIPWVKTGEVRYDTIYDTDEKVTDLAVKKTSIKVAPAGTLLMAMYGQGITRGRVALLGVPATYNQACVAITVNSEICNEYMKWYFIAGYKALRDGGNETSQMNLNADIVRKFKILVPSICEQKSIVEYLANKLPIFDNLLNKTQQQIQLMQERRTALISAAVTGKIDVRDWVKPESNSNQI